MPKIRQGSREIPHSNVDFSQSADRHECFWGEPLERRSASFVRVAPQIMTVVFAGLLVVHGLIHMFGVAKAFGWAELPQLSQPISPMFGALWLLAALLFFAAAVTLFVWPRWWWAIGACAILISMFLVVRFWSDARFGAIGNVVVLIGVVFGFLAQGPVSLRTAYEDDVDRALMRVETAEPIQRGGSRAFASAGATILARSRRRGVATRSQFLRPDARTDQKWPRRPMDAALSRAVQLRR